MKNSMQVEFMSLPENEAFARATVTAFLAQLDPTVDELYDIKMAVSEAVTNSIVHGYEGDPTKKVMMTCRYEERVVWIEIRDEGRGIENIEEAMTSLFTSSPDDERAGLGFTVIQSVMDEVEVLSEIGAGTTVKMSKSI